MYNALGDAKMVLSLDDVEKMKHFIFNRNLRKKTKVHVKSLLLELPTMNILTNVPLLAINILKAV